MAKNLYNAVSIGPATPSGACKLTVHSVFHSTVNLLASSGEDLITLVSGHAPDPPQGIRIAGSLDFSRTGLEKGLPGRLETHSLILQRPDPRNPFRVSLGGVMRLEATSLPAIRWLGPSWDSAARLLDTLQEGTGAGLRLMALFGSPAHGHGVDSCLTRSARALGETARNGSSPEVPVRELVGLGEGLTPSGDDFLCGFLAAAVSRAAADHGLRPYLGNLRGSILGRLHATHAISATYLRCAARGLVIGPLGELAEAIHSGSDPSRPIGRLRLCGHTSGLDLCTGFLFGLSALG